MKWFGFGRRREEEDPRAAETRPAEAESVASEPRQEEPRQEELWPEEPRAAAEDAGPGDAPPGESAAGAAAPPPRAEPVVPKHPKPLGELHGMEARVVDVLRTVYDPEIPVNVYELGLVYDVDVRDAGEVRVVMTLTSPTCPAAQSLPAEVNQKVADVEGIEKVDFELTWEPPWTPERMSEEAKLQLGMF